MNTLVSIIIPTYSRPDNLCRAIDSVIKQTYSPIEIIVVDDNGTGSKFQKETECLLYEYINSGKIKYLKHEHNINGAAARNTGVRESKGQIIGFLDDDDIFQETKIEKQVNRLIEAHSKDSKYCAVYCNSKTINGKNQTGRRISCQEGNLAEQMLLQTVDFNSSTLLMYRTVFDELNGFDERFKRHQDWEFCLRYFRTYLIAVTSPSELLVTKYCTPNVISRNPVKAIEYLEFFFSVNKEDFERMDNTSLVYHKRYMVLSQSLLRAGYFKEGFTQLKKANGFKRLSFKEIVDVLKKIIGVIMYEKKGISHTA